jgi:hypothetical protein
MIKTIELEIPTHVIKEIRKRDNGSTLISIDVDVKEVEYPQHVREFFLENLGMSFSEYDEARCLIDGILKRQLVKEWIKE